MQINPGYDEGYVKFHCEWKITSPVLHPLLDELVSVRDRMFAEGFIGFDPVHKVGYGNISVRLPDQKGFLISATQTGHLANTRAEDYCIVTGWDIRRNQIRCEGPAQASSESMTHAAIYESRPDFRAVIHSHHEGLWRHHFDSALHTGSDIAYGTPEMAIAVAEIVKSSQGTGPLFIVMQGHKDGIIVTGQTLQDAAEYLMEIRNRLHT